MEISCYLGQKSCSFLKVGNNCILSLNTDLNNKLSSVDFKFKNKLKPTIIRPKIN